VKLNRLALRHNLKQTAAATAIMRQNFEGRQASSSQKLRNCHSQQPYRGFSMLATSTLTTILCMSSGSGSEHPGRCACPGKKTLNCPGSK